MSTDKVIKFEDSEQYAQITTAIERITKALEADRSTLFLYDKKIDKLVAHVAEGHDGKTIQVDVGQGIAGTAFKMGTVINVEDAYNSSYFEKKHDEGTGYKTKSVIAIPCFLNSMGNLSVSSRRSISIQADSLLKMRRFLRCSHPSSRW